MAHSWDHETTLWEYIHLVQFLRFKCISFKSSDTGFPPGVMCLVGSVSSTFVQRSTRLNSDQCISKLKLWRALYPLSAHSFDLLPHLLYLQCWYSVVMVFHNFHKRLPHDTHKGIIKSFNSSEEHEESSLLLETPFNWHGGQKLI